MPAYVVWAVRVFPLQQSSEEQGQKFIVSLSFNQDEAPITNPSWFQVVWETPGNHTRFHITGAAGSEGVPAPALFQIDFSNGSDIDIPLNGGSALGPNAGFDL
jgi:hypothetical protein